MRYHFYIYLLLTKIILGQNEVDIRNLQIKDGIYYQPLDVKPYTGKIINVNKPLRISSKIIPAPILTCCEDSINEGLKISKNLKRIKDIK